MSIRFLHSSLAKKYAMALSGIALFIFVILHLLGNLQIFLGPESLNAYAAFLQATPKVVWTSRILLLALVIIHIVAAVKLTRENRAARPVSYENQKYVRASYASRTMFMSGLIVAAFIIYHLLHFTVQVEAVNLTGTDFSALHDDGDRHDVYQMMVIGFSSVWVSVFYLVGVGLLCLHLSHGASSMFQSLGWKGGRYGEWIDRLAVTLAVLIFIGYSAIPLAVLAGLVK